MSKPERLELPKSGGWVEFVDSDAVTGADYRKLRGAAAAPDGDTMNAITLASAEVFIEDWEIPGKPNLSIPRRDRKAVEKLHYRDLYTLEKYMSPMYQRVMEGEEDGDGGDPPAPARD
jgi:hypothetical protein